MVNKEGLKEYYAILNNLHQGAEVNRYGEKFINFVLNSLSKREGRCKRKIISDLLGFALRNEPHYSRHFESIAEEYSSQNDQTQP